MKPFVIAAFALASLSSAALAQSRGSAWWREIEAADDETMPRQMASDYVTNANDCAPDQSRAVWGKRQELLGYACYHPSLR